MSAPPELLAVIQSRCATLKGGEWHFLCPAHEDHHPSARYDPDKCVWVCDTCKSGGGWQELARRLGVHITKTKHDTARQFIASYDYVNESSELLYQVQRFHIPQGDGSYKKDFPCRRPDGNGGWIWNMKDVRRVLFRLPELTGQTSVFAAEGQLCVNQLWDHGLPATCNSGGAGMWTNAHTQQLNAAGVQNVIVLPDNDEPGRKHAQSVSRSCVAAGLAAKIVTLPNLPPKGDVSDYFEAGGTIDALYALVDTAPPWVPDIGDDGLTEESRACSSLEEPFRCTDVGNGKLFAQQHKNNVRYSYGLKQWFIWDGQRWKADDGGGITFLAKQTARSLYARAAQEPHDLRRKTLAKWAAESETERRLKSMVNMAQSEQGMAIEAMQLDADPLLLNVRNGTLDLRTGDLRPARREDFMTKIVSVDYHSNAMFPEFERLLHRIFETAPAVREYLQRIFGYALTGVTTEQCFFILHGTGSNGKSTVLRAILDLLGEYATTTRPETFLTKRGDGIPNDIAALAGARFVVSLESEQGKRLAEGLVKGITGGDKLSARFLNREFFSFAPQLKLFIGTNHKPTITGTDHGMWRRVRSVPFAVVIPDHEQDKFLSDKLRAEYEGILRWLVEGCLAWQRDGLGAPLEMLAATAAYRAEQDVLGTFLKDRCVAEPTAKSTKKDLYDDYTDWCEKTGERHRLTMRDFGKALRERRIIDAKVGNAKGCLGLRLRTSLDAEPDDDELGAAHPEILDDES